MSTASPIRHLISKKPSPYKTINAKRSGVRDFSIVPNVHTDSGDPPSLISNGYRGPFPAVKRPRREVKRSSLSSAEDKNEWS